MNTKQEIRQQLRNTVRKQRSTLPLTFQKTASNLLLAQLSTHSKIKSANHIAIYLTNDGELNTTPFINWCWKNNKRIYLPVIHPFSKGNLLFIEYDKNTPMKRNQYGILEPKLNVNYIKQPNQIDIIFTPLVAFDSLGSRLGMGGGFYDRTLQHWYPKYLVNKTALPYPIGLAHECQQVPYVPTESWDIPIPEIITPTQNFIF